MFKQSHVGRPSNDELKARRNKKILLIGAPIALVLLLVVLIGTGSMNSLMGNSVENNKRIYVIKYLRYSENDYGKTSIPDIYTGKMPNQRVAYGFKTKLRKNKFSRRSESGKIYTFTGWHAKRSDGTWYCISKKTNKAAWVTKNNCKSYITYKDQEIVSNMAKPGDTVTMYAQWDKGIQSKNNILYGDVNADGKINTKDVIAIHRYVITNKNSIDKKAADVNVDSKIDSTDISILYRYILKWEGYTTLPYKGSFKIILGDVNLDGQVNQSDVDLLTGVLSKDKNYQIDNTAGKYAADVNLDGEVDSKDRVILNRHVAGWTDYKTLPYKG